MKNLKRLGKTLSRNEQKQVNGGSLSHGNSSCTILGQLSFPSGLPETCNRCLFFSSVCSTASLSPSLCQALGGVYCGSGN